MSHKQRITVGSRSLAWVAALMLGCVGVGSLSLVSLPAMAQEEMSRVLTVTGQGSVSVETAIAVINLGVVVSGDSAQQVQTQVAEQSNQLVEALQALEVEDIETTGISLNPQYDYRGNQPQQVGVQGQNSIQIEVPVEQAGRILDQAIAAGATQVQSVSLKAEDSTLQDAKTQALEEAVRDARSQADAVLVALDLSFQSIEGIQVNSDYSTTPLPVPYQTSRLEVSRAETQPTPVLGGEQLVSASVTLRIGY